MQVKNNINFQNFSLTKNYAIDCLFYIETEYITVHYELKHFGCLNSMDLIFSNKPRNREKDVERVEQIFPTSDPPFEQ